MREQLRLLVTIPLFLTAPLSYLPAQQIRGSEKLLSQDFNLVPEHSRDTQYYEMATKLQNHAPDGTPQGWDVYHLFLRCVPSKDIAQGDEYTCLKFTIEINNSPKVAIPSLTGWKYLFSLKVDGLDEKGQVFGIDHSKFENLEDEKGNRLPVGNTYPVYNAFIDFHSMSVFAERASGGKGAQDLKNIGDKIIHAASFTEPPVNLGSQIAKGSYFKNGEVVLTFKGLGLVNGKDCAILGYDSGESSFFMKMTPMPGMEITTKGSSHYWGDIYKDLRGGWIQKATMHEMVVAQTVVPGQTGNVNSVIERSTEIKNVQKPVF